MNNSLLVTVSGHGYGHATRVTRLLRALARRRPELKLIVHSVAPRWLWRPPSVPAGVVHYPISYDLGMAQDHCLSVDVAGTIPAMARQRAELPRLREQFERTLREEQVLAVVSDIAAPPLAWAAAAGVPAIGISNFSWDVIYDHYAKTDPRFQPYADECRAAYRQTDLFLRLPLGPEMPAFPRTIEVPLLARISAAPREATRERLRWRAEETVILLSFGGFPPAAVRSFPKPFPADRHFVSFRPWEGDFPGRLTVLDDTIPLPHEDILAAADLVIGKPGYGLISECIANRRKLLYVFRDDFPECPALIAGAERYAVARVISQAAFLAGEWHDPAAALLAETRPWPECRTDGDEVAAGLILKEIGRG